jgi:glycosyltransferase involved in cell wall biosynthesis
MVLTIYIPTYKRESVVQCVESIVGQLTNDVELIISDNDQDAFAGNLLYPYKDFISEYSVRKQNIGCDGNCLYGVTTGTGEYVWVMGDDDVLLPGAIATLLPMLNGVDRVMQYAPCSGELKPGFSGTMVELINSLNDKSYVIAATLASMNIWRRDVMDFKTGVKHLDSRNVLAWSGINCETVSIPNIPTVLVNDTNHFVFKDFDNVMFEYCDALSDIDGVEKFTFDNANKWNFVNASMEKK